MLEEIIDIFVYSILGMREGTAIASAVHFFIYDSIKILLLLYVMILFIGILRTYVSKKKMRDYLSGKGIFSYIFAAVFGAATPFCSCSSIPLFISFIQAGAPLGAAFTFLITSPLINEYLAVLMFGFFGPKVTILYILLGMILGVTAGLAASKMKLQKYIVEDLKYGECCNSHEYRNIQERVSYGRKEASQITKMLWKWIFIGVGIGAFIHGFVPQAFIESLLEAAGILSVPIAVILGVPIYANCAAIVPIAVVLFEKGLPLGTAIAFMMASAALSIPEAVILRRVMKLKLVIIFFGMTTMGIIIIGYLLNFLT